MDVVAIGIRMSPDAATTTVSAVCEISVPLVGCFCTVSIRTRVPRGIVVVCAEIAVAIMHCRTRNTDLICGFHRSNRAQGQLSGEKGPAMPRREPYVS